MKITKFVHACLLVETPERVVLFDPGVMSEAALNLDDITQLDDIFITHIHPDHVSTDLIKKLVAKFPQVRITSTKEVVAELAKESITASNQPPEGVTFFDSPHENVIPIFPKPEQVGFHYLDVFSDPGDSHSFSETKAILALPITAPWGSTVKAINLALELKPEYVVPIHDWHWSDAAREQMYDRCEQLLAEQGIKFFKMKIGEPVEISL